VEAFLGRRHGTRFLLHLFFGRSGEQDGHGWNVVSNVAAGKRGMS
jgi:hypothetical protein